MTAKKHRLALALALGTLISFVYHGISWEVLSWHRASIGAATDEAAATACLESELGDAGVYLLPNPPAQPEDRAEASMKHMLEGPAAFVAWRNEAFSMPVMFAKELGRQLVSTVLLAVVLLGFVGPGTARKTLAAALIGGFAAVACHLQGWVHFYFPAAFVIPNVADAIIGTSLVGFVIAKLTGKGQ